ncbi:helix-turn-helix transcriptional regulator [Schumannella soli]|uniref:Helix-turn-helix transcriptional regulator n=1 Tax=Schumannella soli TaxID=2590779 RepID=A0A506XUC3_9MICO|nr:helix-turn-helix transcriptional regulator [Schumannella soli]TPW76301.1 helix-turn-helix transcriptional regulator [Schumannella soli]
MSDDNELGDYLRARRGLVDPTEVGLPGGGVRRTPGLRREEVATLAGISADYYLRLEQGRDRNPSGQVLEALARVLLLDGAATAYLHGLVAERGAPRARTRRASVPAGIRQLLGTLNLPAFVEDRAFTVLAANRLATAVSPAIVEGENRLRSMLLDPREYGMHRERDRAVAGMVATFRASIGPWVDDPSVRELVGELSLTSETFRRLWARHDVREVVGSASIIDHPEVGEFAFRREKLTIGDADGQLLVIYHPEPGSPSAQKLALLGSLHASDARPLDAADPAADETGAAETTDGTTKRLSPEN